MLALEDVAFSRASAFRLSIDKLEIAPGERVTVLGPSGSGKTTLVRLIAGLESPERGRISIEGRQLNGSPPHTRPISLLAQDLGLWPHLSALEHVAFSRARGRTLKPQEADRELLASVQLDERSAARPHQLSGGERQRLAMARALARRPKLLLLDEPFSNVDPVLAAELHGILDRLHAQWGLTRLQVRHWTFGEPRANERFIVVRAGRIVQDGTWLDLSTNPRDPWIERLVSLAKH